MNQVQAKENNEIQFECFLIECEKAEKSLKICEELSISLIAIYSREKIIHSENVSE